MTTAAISQVDSALFQAGQSIIRRRGVLGALGAASALTVMPAQLAQAVTPTSPLKAYVSGGRAKLVLTSHVITKADVGAAMSMSMALPTAAFHTAPPMVAWVDRKGAAHPVRTLARANTLKVGTATQITKVTAAMVGGTIQSTATVTLKSRQTARGKIQIGSTSNEGSLVLSPTIAPTATADAASMNSITSAAVTVSFDGQVRIARNGKSIASIGGLYLSDGARATVGTVTVNQGSLVVTYTAPSGYQGITGTFSIIGDAVRSKFSFTAPAGYWADGAMVLRTIDGQGTRTALPVNDWVKDANGGLPMFVHRFTAYRNQTSANGVIWECVQHNNTSWVNDTDFQSPAKELGNNRYEVEHLLVTKDLGIDNLPLAQGARLVADTDLPFNWLTTPGSVTVGLRVAGAAVAGTVSWTVHSFTGAQLTVGSQATSGSQKVTFSVGLPEVGSYYVVAQWTGSNGATAHTRTMLTVSPNLAGVPSGAFGVSALRPHVGAVNGVQRAHWFTLMSGMGVSRLRQPDDITPAEGSRARLVCNQNVPVANVSSIDGRDTLFAKWVADAKAFNSPYIELGNELNKMVSDDATGAADYTRNWIIPFKAYMKARGCTAKLLVSGLAGPNIGWLKGIDAAGGWKHIDAVALHPGRGNHTADFVPGVDPTIQGGDYWNFLGAVRAVKATKNVLDAKNGTHTDFLLTEAYACTYPNSWWEDTHRHAAENVLLSCALARAEGVDSVYWYMPHDGIQDDRDAGMRLDMADSVAREYHFGLLNGDNSIKPAMLALAMASAHLGDATFVKSVTKGTTHALVFKTPRGLMQVMWDRTDGYLLNKGHESQMYTDKAGRSRWNSPEWWVDQWPTKLETHLAATGPVKVISCIGAARTVSPVGGAVDLTLDGAPVIVYGLAPLA